MEAKSGVTRSIIDELHSRDIQGDKMEDESGIIEGSLMNFFFGYRRRSKGRRK